MITDEIEHVDLIYFRKHEMSSIAMPFEKKYTVKKYWPYNISLYNIL